MQLCVVHFFQDFSHETRSNEKQQSKQGGENEQLKREKKVKKYYSKYVVDFMF